MIIKITTAQNQALRALQLHLDDLYLIRGCDIHSILLANALWDGQFLLFINTYWNDVQKFLYYIGAEHEGIPHAMWLDVTVIKGIDPWRLERYMIEENLVTLEKMM